MSELLSTTDYSIFKFLPGRKNRHIKPRHLQAMIEAVTTSNILETHPLIVNPDMEVLEGQHRLLAAKTVGVPVYYIVGRDMSHEEIALMNLTHRLWEAQDYLNCFCDKGLPNYLRFQALCDKYKLAPITLLHLLPGDKSVLGKDFKSGKLPPFDTTFTEATMGKVVIVKDYLKEHFPWVHRELSSSRTFIKALIHFLGKELVDIEIFLKKLRIKGSLLRVCPTQKDYMVVLHEVYNFRNNKPVIIEK